MAKRKAPSPSPSGSGSDNVAVAQPQRNVRQKLLHLAPRPTPAGSPFRTVDFVSIPRGEQPSQDELSVTVEDTQQPYYERPLIVSGKRLRTQNSQRRTLRDLWGLAQPSEEHPSYSAPVQQAEIVDLTIDTPEPPALPAAQSLRSATGGADEESSEDLSGSSSRRPRRSMARQSYVEQVVDDGDAIVYEKSSSSRRSGRFTKAPTRESDCEDEASEHELEIESEEESQVEESEPESAESMDEGYDSGVKLKGKNTIKKTNSMTKSTAPTVQGFSKTGRRTGKITATEMGKLLGREAGEPKGLDTGLPPLSSIDDIFKDITTKALDIGLREILQQTNRQPLRVATMCSGTESPVLALDMVQDALKSLGEPGLQVDHLFSAEIVPYKQAYIERNFQPKIIFRDIT